MIDSGATSRRKRRTAKPLDTARLEELAVAYVARFATSSGKLRTYLLRKIRERGWAEDGTPDIDQLVRRFITRGYVDDEAYSRAKAADLTARGYGGRRVDQALRAAGISDEVRESAQPGQIDARQAAIKLAQRRGFGPFAKVVETDPHLARKEREKRLAVMMRAGHDFAAARKVVEAQTIEELEQWVAEAGTEFE